MSLKKFLAYILRPDGRSAKVVNDVVTYTGQPTPLPEMFDGWQELFIAFERSVPRHGLQPSYTLPAGFVRKAARILRDAIYKETTEATLQLLIQRRTLIITPTTYNHFYKYFYRGEIDLSAAEDDRDIFRVPIIEGGYARQFKANEKTVYEFPMNDPVCVNVEMDGIDIQSKLNYLVNDNTYTVDSLVGVTFLNTEGTNFAVAGFTIAKQNLPGDLTTSPEYFLEIVADTTIRVYGQMKIRLEGLVIGTPPTLNIELRSSTGSTTIIIPVTIPVSPDPYTFDVPIATTAGTKWFLVANQSFTGTPNNFWHILESEIFVEVKSRYRTTQVKCYRRYDLFKKICGKMFGTEDAAISDLLQIPENDSILITCGDAIRGLEGATLKTSFADFDQDCDANFMTGHAVLPNGLEVEGREHYYDESEEEDLGIVTNLVIRPAKDLKCNTFKFGHPKQDIEDINGKYDPNGTNQFTGPITKDVNEYDGTSPYKAGPYEIEVLRINLDGKTTTDDNSDNDTFIIAAVPQPSITVEVSFFDTFQGFSITNADRFLVGQKIRITGSTSNDGVYDIVGVSPFLSIFTVSFTQPTVAEASVTVTIEWLVGGIYTLNRPAYDVLEGVPNDTIFNLPVITPKTKLKRHGRWVRSMNAGLDNQKIKFANGKENKNTALLTELAGVTVDEDADEAISDLGDYLFLPWYFTFKTEVPVDLAEILEANPNKSFIFTDEWGQTWRGFLRIGGIAPNEYTPQEFKLLAAPSNDIELLIHGK